MGEDRARLPLSDPPRERFASEYFPFREQSPEEFAARNAHAMFTFSFDDVRYRDPALDAWIGRLGDILFRRPGAPGLDELRERFLTAEERAEIARRSGEEL
jgi:hypothetical protein